MRRQTFRPRSRAHPFRVERLLACVLCFVCCCASYSQAASSRVEGVVTDQAGDAVANASVTLRTGAAAASARTTTDSEGHFRLEAGAAGGNLILAVSAQGFARFETTLDAAPPGPTELKVTLTPAPLSEQVTVTASRTETRLGETPASIAAISQADLATTAAATLDDALRQVAGFSLFRRSGSRAANPTTQGVSLRGVGASGASRAVVLADNVPLNDPFGGWVYWGRVPRTSVAGVEVLRGGASHLYGSSALGGVINIQTPGASQRAPFLSLEASIGNGGTADGSIFAGAGRGPWGVSLAAESFRTDGYVIVDERQRGPVDIEAGVRNSVVKLTVERALPNAGRVFASASSFGEARSNGAPLQTNRTHIRQFVTGLDWRGERAGSLNLRAYGGTQVFDQNFSAVSLDRSVETLTRVQRVPAQSFGLSAQWSRAAGKRQTLVAGLEGREVRGASDEIVYAAGRPTSLVGAGGRERTVGLFFEDIIRLTPRLLVTAGARVDRWRNYAALNTSRQLSTQVQTTTAFPDRTEMAFSPHLSLLFSPTEHLSLYAAAGRAFRQPTLNELYRSFRVGDVLTLANENLRAERLTGGEAGASLNTFGRKLNLRGAFFWAEITRPVANVTLRIQPGLITRQRQNLGRTRSRGVELEWQAPLSPRWTLSGGYLYSDAIVLRFPANTALEGLRVPQAPRHQLTLQARYTNPSIITLSLQARASGGQFDDDQNLFLLEKYFTLDALASRRLGRRAEAFVAAENLLGGRYAVGLTPVRTVGPPPLVRLGLRLRLGSRR